MGRSTPSRHFLLLAGLAAALIPAATHAAPPDLQAPTLSSDPHRLCTEYDRLGDVVVIEGDIAIGTCRRNERGWNFEPRGRFAEIATGLVSADPTKAAVTPSSWYWDDGIVPYVISAPFSLANDPATHEDILSAIRHWNAQSVVQIVPRTGETHYVEFVTSTGCSSYLGQIGGRQEIYLATGGGCGYGSTIHEIGHALGHYHEQSRQDRDGFVTILWENIEAGRESNFEIYSSGSDLNAYDFGSIMHYFTTAFSSNGSATIVEDTAAYDAWKAIYGDIPIGQRLELSILDRLASDEMYNVCSSSAAAGAPYWQANPWRSCSASCAAPGRSREVFCHAANGTCAADGACDPAARPTQTETCADLLDCDFDTDNCAWDSVDGGDNFNWSPAFGSTPSSGTGPSGDHTSGSGYYLYTEMSSPRTTGDVAYLTSAPVDFGAGSTLSFWFHFFGTGLGTLEVELVPCGGPPQTLLTISTADTSSLDLWRKAFVDIPAAANAGLRFKMTRAASFSSDVAIDDITVNVVADPDAVFSDGFESGDMTAWSQVVQ